MPKQTKSLKEQSLKKKAKQPIGKSKKSLKEQSLEYDHISVIEETRDTLSPLEGLKGFELYKNWRNTLFEMLRGIIEHNNTEKANALSNAANLLKSELDIFFECGFFHEAYKHNILLSVDAFINHFDNPDKIQENLYLIDLYVLPKLERDRSFETTFQKTLSGVFAYLLIEEPKCSERLAIHISKQVFNYKADQSVFEELYKIKKYFGKKYPIPLSLYLAIFYTIFSMRIDWKSIKPRAKHERSISDRNKALQHLQEIRVSLVNKYIQQAQTSILNQRTLFESSMNMDFMEKILTYKKQAPIEIDDEFVLGILFASFFGDTLYSNFLLPKN